MAIIGLTDELSIRPSLPRLGKLRKGGEKQKRGEKEIQGKDLDYFRFTSSRPEIMEAYRKYYGTNLKSLHVYLPYATPHECFETWMEAWGKSVLLHRCDGQRVILMYDQQAAKHVRYDHLQYDQRPVCPGGCKHGGRLELILPDLWEHGFPGYVTMETHSKHDLIRIMSLLQKYYQERQNNGHDLRGIEFTLRRITEQVSVPINGKRALVKKSLVEISPSIDWSRLQIQASKAQEKREQRMLLGEISDDEHLYESDEDDIIDVKVENFENDTSELSHQSDIESEQQPQPSQFEFDMGCAEYYVIQLESDDLVKQYRDANITEETLPNLLVTLKARYEQIEAECDKLAKQLNGDVEKGFLSHKAKQFSGKNDTESFTLSWFRQRLYQKVDELFVEKNRLENLQISVWPHTEGKVLAFRKDVESWFNAGFTTNDKGEQIPIDSAWFVRRVEKMEEDFLKVLEAEQDEQVHRSFIIGYTQDKAILDRQTAATTVEELVAIEKELLA